jgi:hypothetical protein
LLADTATASSDVPHLHTTWPSTPHMGHDCNEQNLAHISGVSPESIRFVTLRIGWLPSCQQPRYEYSATLATVGDTARSRRSSATTPGPKAAAVVGVGVGVGAPSLFVSVCAVGPGRERSVR